MPYEEPETPRGPRGRPRTRKAPPQPVDPTVVDVAHRMLMGSPQWIDIVRARYGLDPESVRRHSLGLNCNQLYIPIFDPDGKLLNVHVRDLGKAHDEARRFSWLWSGHPAPPCFNPKALIEPYETLGAEGELKAMLLEQLTGRPAWSLTAGVKAGLPPNARPWAAGKRITYCADPDAPGRTGAALLREQIGGHAAWFETVFAPPVQQDGIADVNDWVVKGGATATDVEALLASVRQGVGLDALKEAFSEHLYLSDHYFLEVVLGALAANRVEGDPLWLLIVMPPSGAKTEVLLAASALNFTHLLSSLTPQTLISGFRGKNASLLPKISDKILILKDFTTVLTMQRDSRAEVFAQLREVYDGKLVKAFGTGEEISWTGKVGLIGGVTEVIDGQTAVHSVLGERFILYRPETQDRWKVGMKAVGNVGRETAFRRQLGDAVVAFFRGVIAGNGAPVLMSEESIDTIVRLADLTAKGRASVPREGYSRRIEYVPHPEIPARLAKQFAQLAQGIARCRGACAIGEHELDVLRRVARDTMIRQRVVVLEMLARLRGDEWARTKAVAEAIRHPVKTALELLEDAWMVGLIERDITGKGDDHDTDQEEANKGGRLGYTWRLAGPVSEDVEKTALFSDTVPF
jgi:hypothetical protein